MKKTIVLNWKCNPVSWAKAKPLLNVIKQNKAFLRGFELIVAAPFVYLEKLAKEKGIRVSAQDCFWEKQGPFTGEVSPLMIKDAGADFVMVGHSERKRLFGENELTANKKMRAALNSGLNVLLFFGEKKRRSLIESKKEIIRQLEVILAGVAKKDLPKTLFVYEPVFAVSTQGGWVLSSAEVRQKTLFIKKYLALKFGLKGGEKAKLCYGGSVDGKKAKEYLGISELDGLVVGQASIVPSQLKKLVNSLS